MVEPVRANTSQDVCYTFRRSLRMAALNICRRRHNVRTTRQASRLGSFELNLFPRNFVPLRIVI